MDSSGSMTRPPCANQEDMSNKWEDASLDKVKEKDVNIRLVGVEMFAR